MLQELLQTLFLVSFTLGLVLLGILLSRKLYRQSNLICASYVIISLIPLWNGYFKRTENLQLLDFSLLGLMYPWLFGPLLFLYCRSLQDKALPRKMISLHCLWPVPALITVLIFKSFSVSLSNQIFFHLYLAILYGQIYLYTYFSYKTVLKQSQAIEKQYAGQEVQAWLWLNLLVKGFALIFVFDLIMLVLNISQIIPYRFAIDIFEVTESLYIFILIGFVFRQPHLFFDRFDTSRQVKYQNSGLNQELAKNLAQRLEATVTSRQLYLDNELNLQKIALLLKVPEAHISQVLSEQIGQNFYEFINRKRIEQAKQLLSSNDPSYDNILQLAFSVGFNNKTSFNTAFKRFTQVTPSQFRQKKAAAHN